MRLVFAILCSVRARRCGLWLRVARIVVPEVTLSFAAYLSCTILNAISAGLRFGLRVANVVVPEVVLTFAGSLSCTVLDTVDACFRLRLRIADIVVPIMPAVDTIRLG